MFSSKQSAQSAMGIAFSAGLIIGFVAMIAINTFFPLRGEPLVALTEGEVYKVVARVSAWEEPAPDSDYHYLLQADSGQTQYYKLPLKLPDHFVVGKKWTEDNETRYKIFAINDES